MFERGFERGVERGFERGFERVFERGVERVFERGVERGFERVFERGPTTPRTTRGYLPKARLVTRGNRIAIAPTQSLIFRAQEAPRGVPGASQN